MDVLGESSFEDIARTIRWNGTVAEVAMLAAEVEALEYAAPLRELLSTAQDQHGLLPMPINYSGPLARPMAALSGLLGIADEARAFYDEALDSAAALGARPTLARIGLEAAPVLARAGDLASARDRLRESHAMALEIGMPRVAEDARKALERY